MDLMEKAGRIRAVFFDIDGTLVPRETNDMTERTKRALRALQARGILVCLASGRSPQSMERVQELFPFDGSVAVNGQYCSLPGGQVLHKHAYTREQTALFTAYLRAHQLACLFASAEGNRINFANGRMRGNFKTVGQPLPPVMEEDWPLEREMLQFMVFAGEEWDRPMEEAMPFLHCVRAIEPCVDIHPVGGGKLRGIEAMCAHFGFGLESCMACGDGNNDGEMVARCGIGVAMGDGPAALREKADLVTGTAEEDGIVLALERLGMI